MSEQAGEKTEKATSKRLEEALKKGQIARSPEVQTVFVLGGAMLALGMTGGETWRTMAQSCMSTWGHLHDTPVTLDAMQGYTITGALALAHCVLPIMVATVTGGLLAGGIQTRFRASSEALEINWERLNPVEGFKRLFSMRSTVATGLGIVKLTVVIVLCYNVIKKVLSDPIFYSSVDVARIASFMAESSFKIIVQVGVALVLLAAVDYSYKFWQTNEDLKMTKEEVKDEAKNAEGDPTMKGRIRRRRQTMSKRKMLAEVPKADVVVVNP